MGLVAGDRVPWKRWWFPSDAQVVARDGILPDPSGGFTRYLNPSASTLDAYSDGRGIILLGDSGMGKSYELAAEIDRRRSTGEHVIHIDMGEFSTIGELQSAIRDAVAGWQATGADELTLAFDGFDELMSYVENLNNVFQRELERLDPSRFRVLIASRSSLWPESLSRTFASWWQDDDVSILTLGPLTESDIRTAATAEGLDACSFMNAVSAAGALPLAARPVTLRMLLRGEPGRPVPSRRIDAYRMGIDSLIAENSARRQERRREGTPLPQRVAAAKHLAAVSLLAGCPQIVRRSRPGTAGRNVALDEVVTDQVTLDALDDVFDSALLSGQGATRVWAHRSFEEYLCAGQLAGLPLATAASLLTDPAATGRILAQLADTAAWLAALNSEALTWVAERDPAALINPDLRSRPEQERQLVGRALLARLHDDEVFVDRTAYDGLAYDGLADDLKVLVEPAQPAWRRREAARLVAATGLRDLDGELVRLIELAAAQEDPASYSEDVQGAIWAALALRGCTDTVLLSRLKAVACNDRAPRDVRAQLVAVLWPKTMSTADLIALFDIASETPAQQSLRRQIALVMPGVFRTAAVRPTTLLAWLGSWPISAHHDRRLDQLASLVICDAVDSLRPGTAEWHIAAGFIRRRLEVTSDLFEQRMKFAELSDDRRRALARAALIGRRDYAAISHFLVQGIIVPDDLSWWLGELARGLEADHAAALSARSVVEALAAVVPTEDASAATAVAVTMYDSLRDAVDEIFGESAIARRAVARAEEDLRLAERAVADEGREFSKARLEAAFAACDFAAVTFELDRPVASRRDLPRRSSWSTLEEGTKQQVCEAALLFLRRDDLGPADFDTTMLIVEALKIMRLHDPESASMIPDSRWIEWLPELLTSPEGYMVVQTALSHAAQLDPRRTDEILIAEMRRETDTGYVMLPELIGSFQSTSLSQAALDLANSVSVQPDALPGLLRLAETRLPAESVAAALQHIGRRSASADGLVATQDTGQDPNRKRAVAAAAALVQMDQLPGAFADLLAVFREDVDFALGVIRASEQSDEQAWRSLRPDQLAELYLWARDHVPPSPPLEPGVAVRVDPVQDLPNEIIRRLSRLADPHAVTALTHLGDVTGDIWIKHAGRAAGDSLQATQWRPPNPAAVKEVLQHPERRAISTPSQLATVVLESLDDLAGELRRDRALRAQLWHRQRRSGQWVGYVPLDEIELSDWLSRELRRQLRWRVALLREVETQPRLSEIAGDVPDLLVVSITTGIGSAELPVEVKCNWHDEVSTAIETQLGQRYLNGPHGTTGIYIVGFYSGNAWRQDDPRKRKASHCDRSDLVAQLRQKLETLAARSITAYYRLIDLGLDN